MTVWHWFDGSSGFPFKTHVRSYLVVVEVVGVIVVVYNQGLKYKNVVTTVWERSLKNKEWSNQTDGVGVNNWISLMSVLTLFSINLP